MKLKSLERTIITCKVCSKQQEFCITGRPLSGLCTECRKKDFRRDNPELKKPECFCTLCHIKIGKNSKLQLCRKCNIDSKKDFRREYNNKYTTIRYTNDKIFMISKRLRSRLSHAMRELTIENRKVSSIKNLGCSPKEFATYLESLFQPGMSWKNYGKWHIDHIIPLSSAVSEACLYKLVHFTNLQPLWAKDNLIKGAKLS